MATNVDSQARSAILARLRPHQGTAQKESAVSAPTSSQNPDATQSVVAVETYPLVTSFCDELTLVGGEVITATTQHALYGQIEGWLEGEKARSVMLGTCADMDPLAQVLQSSGLIVHRYLNPYEKSREQIFEADCGITFSAAGIAETGSVVLTPNPTEPRLLSIAMPLHVVILRRDQLYPTLASYLASQPFENGEQPANWIIITGPSRTADIELTLVMGVHGPKKLLVALLD